jgi:hypothetical protein
MKLSMRVVTVAIVAGAVYTGCAKPPAQPAVPGGAVQTAPPSQPGADITLPAPTADKLTAAEQKLDAALLDLSRAGDAKEPALAAWGARHRLSVANGRVSVDITCRTTAEANHVAASLRKARAEITAKFENTVYARIAPRTILTIANMPEVWTMTASRKVIGRI